MPTKLQKLATSSQLFSPYSKIHLSNCRLLYFSRSFHHSIYLFPNWWFSAFTGREKKWLFFKRSCHCKMCFLNLQTRRGSRRKPLARPIPNAEKGRNLRGIIVPKTERVEEGERKLIDLKGEVSNRNCMWQRRNSTGWQINSRSPESPTGVEQIIPGIGEKINILQ